MLQKTKNTPKVKSKQKFLRLNLDSKLDNFIQSYQSKYSLLSQGDIVRMLLSEIYYQKQTESRQKMLGFVNTLPPANHSFDQDQIFDILKKENLD
jgi:hypothetical protein